MFGEITNSKLLGGWTLKLEKADKLPQILATAFYNLYGAAKFGGSYLPSCLLATQQVNGTNYKLAAERIKQISGGKIFKDFAIVTINIPAGDLKAEKASKVDEEDINDFVLRDEIEKGVKKAFANFAGPTHKPLIELGEQITKGKTYHFVCESRGTYADADPYLTRVAINNFQDNWTIDEIVRL